MSTPAEIRELDRTVAVQEILRFDVSMDDFLCMEILQGLNCLTNVISCLNLIKSPVCCIHQLLINLTTGRKFKYQINLCVVPKETKESANIFMSQMALNFDLSSYLMFILGVNNLFDVHDLQSNDELALLLSCKIDMAELTSPHWFSKFKVIK